MSCGNAHDMPCVEVRSLMYLYIDNELDEVHYLRITTHLTECSPCDEIVNSERAMIALVGRSCQCEPAPEALRVRIVSQISQLRIEYRSE